MEKSTEGIESYHERTKHHPHRYARSAGYLDWESEPDPFRRYEGAPLARLPLREEDPVGTFQSMFDRRGIESRPFSLNNIACFLELSLGLSAWKSYGENAWALRMNPSSGNLHPVEGYPVMPPLPDEGFSGGVYHYSPFFHGLEMRASFDQRFWSQIMRHFPAGFFAGLSSIHWRESWKYGERAFRYSHLDMGHAVAAMGFSAALLGWKIAYLNALSDLEVETVLGFNKTRWREFEREEAGPLLFIHKAMEHAVPRGLSADIIHIFESLTFAGEPNLLSRRHRDWSVIEEASAFTIKPATRNETYDYENHPFVVKNTPPLSAAAVIRRRRSALAFDARTALAGHHFFDILDRTIPRNDFAPFDGYLGRSSINLLIFAHRIIGLEPGLYFLVRERKDVEEIKQKFRSGFLWKREQGVPETLPLYILEQGDFRSKAQSASCDQDIAGDGAFSVAMIAEFRDAIEQGPHRYRHLHWEAGMIGQVLYLASETYGMRGTGMGCFFDDRVHELLGLQDTFYQDIYHFGVGKPVEDTRIAILPPYQHLQKNKPTKSS
jgi:SagB-type dehydrogenase family enzyme